MFKNKLRELLATIGMVLGAVLLLTLFILLMANTFPVNASAACEDEVQVINPVVFDTTAIDAWCRGEDFGTVRMVGAWWYADGVVEDEQGQLWGIEQRIEQTDFLLLWIADNHTPNNTTDDIVIKVWREAY